MRSLKAIRKKTLWVLLFVFFLVGCSIFDFVFLIHRNLNESVQLHLITSTNTTIQQVEESFSNRFRSLAVLASVIGASGLPVHDSQQFTMFSNMSKSEDFSNLLLIDKDGIGVALNGETYDVSHREYFHKAMQGKRQISDLMVLVDGKKYVVFAVPIYRSDEIIGVLAFPYLPETFLSMLDTNVFNSRCESYLVRSDGSIIIKNTQDAADENFSDSLRQQHISETVLQSFLSDLEQQKEDTMEYKLGDCKYYARYMPIGRHGWMLVNTVRGDVLNSYWNAVSKNASILAVKLILILSGFILYGSISWNKWKNKLDKAENKCRWIASSVPISIIHCKADEFYTMNYMDDGFQRITGYTREELEKDCNVRYMDLIYPPDRPYVFEQLRRNLKDKKIMELEYRFIRKDGKVIWFKEKAQSTDGKEIRSVLIDITAEKEMEITRLHAENVKSTLFCLSDEFFFVHTLKTDEVEFSHRFQEFFGEPASRTNYIQHLIQDQIVHEKDQEVVLAFCDTYQLGCGALHLTLHMKDAKGVFHHCRVRLEPIFDRDRRVVKTIGKLTLLNEKEKVL